MNIISRFLSELTEPELKCERVGHNIRTVSKKIRMKSYGVLEVVADYQADFDVCCRCGDKSEPYNERKIDSFNGCSMPRSMWDEMKDKGYLEL
ncbi:MAG: hypothetical protein GY799_16915 [Desulfobulbaceae bacterium]|nr:hypothetical protein [Desulfobulbaceae bacterium]